MANDITIRTDPSSPFIFLPVMINGRGPFDFVLDTGAGMTIITDDLAVRLGIRKTGTRDGVGAPGVKLSISLGSLDSLAVGDASVSNLEVGFLNQLPKCAGDGALGYNFLKHFTITVDYPAGTVTLARAATGETAVPGTVPSARGRDDGLMLTLARPDRPLILVDATIGGGNMYRFVLDTGASTTVVSPGVFTDCGMTPGGTGPVVGAGGGKPGTAGVLGSVAVGGTVRTDLGALSADIFDGLSDAIGVRIDGILGYNFLRHFRMKIDYPGQILSFSQCSRDPVAGSAERGNQ